MHLATASSGVRRASVTGAKRTHAGQTHRSHTEQTSSGRQAELDASRHRDQRQVIDLARMPDVVIAYGGD